MTHQLSRKLVTCALFGASTFIVSAVHAQIYVETGDSGETADAGQTAPGEPGVTLTAIDGTFNDVNDADFYRFTLSSTTTLQATTTLQPTPVADRKGNLDTELFLFDDGGVGIVANDDSPSDPNDPSTSNIQSTFTYTLNPGTYIVGISLSGNEPVDMVSQLVFDDDTTSTAQRGPNPNASAQTGFTQGSNTGSGELTTSNTYRIRFSNSAAIPEPGTTALLVIGALLGGVFILRRRSAGKKSLGLSLLAVVSAGTLSAKQPIPANLGNGLDKLVQSALLVKKNPNMALVNGYASKDAASFASMALHEKDSKRVMVNITLNGRVPVSVLASSLPTKFSTLTITSTDPKYRGVGMLEGYLSVDEAAALAQTNGVSAVLLALRPILSAVTSQGVHQHRVDLINQAYNAAAPVNYTGAGLSIGVMSDSYDQSVAEGGSTRAATDVASQDLPGVGNATNSQPVVVLEDLPVGTTSATDEGRGMCQIVYDIAPGARIGFASASVGEVGFANNIRALAGLTGFTKDPAVQMGFKGDVVCDDVSYLDEPIFQDGIVAQGVIDAVNAGVTYTSSAANNTGTDGYSSVFRPVPNGTGLTAASNSALAGTNIDLTGVPAAYYAGGFQNFKPSGGLDVAQLVNTSSDAPFVLQWNDPYDVAPPTIGAQIFSGMGTSTGGSSMDFGPFNFTAGQAYYVSEMATPGLPTDNFDGIVSIIDPNGNVIVDQDTGTDETVVFFAPTTGAYTVRVRPYSTPAPVVGGADVPTQGSYSLTVNFANGTARLTQDFNVLFFDTAGKFISALATNNIANNRPIELASLSFTQAQVQLVISRSNTTTPPNAADQLKYVFFGNGLSGIGPAEYGSPLTPVTFGHSAAAGANSVAAYSVFRPNIPEDFTSPGPVAIYFDANSNRLATPQLRLKPDIAASDAVNNTFFPFGPTPGLGDSLSDPDTFPNFSGTSAASPHAAALAALVLQAHGGSGSLTPAQVKSIFQKTAFAHDLDPYSASGSAKAANGGKVSIVVNNDNYTGGGTGLNDVNAWNVTYVGSGRLTNLVFNREGTALTGGNTTGGNSIAVVPAQFLMPTSYKSTPGMVFNTTFNRGNSVGLASADVVPTFTNPAPAPSTGQSWTLNLAFPNNNFTGGKVLRFNVDRDQQQDSTSPQGMTTQQLSADLLGGSVKIPEDPNATSVLPGMTFSGTIVDGAQTYSFSGRLANRNAKGYSVLDGFGLINAEAAVNAAP